MPHYYKSTATKENLNGTVTFSQHSVLPTPTLPTSPRCGHLRPTSNPTIRLGEEKHKSLKHRMRELDLVGKNKSNNEICENAQSAHVIMSPMRGARLLAGSKIESKLLPSQSRASAEWRKRVDPPPSGPEAMLKDSARTFHDPKGSAGSSQPVEPVSKRQRERIPKRNRVLQA